MRQHVRTRRHAPRTSTKAQCGNRQGTGEPGTCQTLWRYESRSQAQHVGSIRQIPAIGNRAGAWCWRQIPSRGATTRGSQVKRSHSTDQTLAQPISPTEKNEKPQGTGERLGRTQPSGQLQCAQSPPGKKRYAAQKCRRDPPRQSIRAAKPADHQGNIHAYAITCSKKNAASSAQNVHAPSD